VDVTGVFVAAASAGGDGTPLWQWIVGTVVAVLAAGSGIVAFVKWWQGRSRLTSRLGFEDNDYYRSWGGHDLIKIASVPSALPSVQQAESAPPMRLRLLLDVTNDGDETVALDSMELAFDSVEALTAPPTQAIIATLAPGADTERIAGLAERLGLDLRETGPGLARYVVRDRGADVAVLAQRLKAESDVIMDAFADSEGHAHTEFVATEPVDINLRPDRLAYSYRIAHTLTGHDTLTVPIDLGAVAPLRGRASITLCYGGRRRTRVGALEVDLRLPAYVQTVEKATVSTP
jgi:hypothetical protein